MGNCCSSKRANGYDSESTEDSSQILKDTGSHLGHHPHNHHISHHHHIGHHHHGGGKRNSGSSSTTELKLMNDIIGNNNNKRNSKKLIEEEKEDLLLSVSSHNNNNITNNGSINELALEQTIYKTNNSNINNNNNNSSSNNYINESVISGTHSHHSGKPTQLSQSYPYTHTHTRQLSTERVSNCGPQFKTPISSIPQHMRMEGFQRTKHNSTSSLYITSTLSQPDNDEILKCMANALLYHIEKGTQSPMKAMIEIFSEEKYPITKGKLDLKSMPTVDVIYRFIRDIFKAEKLDSECAIMCLAYIERIITFTGTTLHPTNWRRIVLSALILASKVWEDQSVWNVDFLPVFDNLTAADLNCLERQFLSLLQYNVSLTASIYAKYYFELRTFSTLDSSQFPLDPLDKTGVKRLEDHSKASEYRVKPFKRSASVDQINPPEPHNRAVLN